MKIYILGICGTFMGSLAVIAKQMGFEVAGTDSNVYPPMSDVLSDNGIQLDEGYDVEVLKAFTPDCVIIGNAITRGNACLEYVLNEGLNYDSGPAWLATHVLSHKRVIAISGTHGKTTTTSMVCHLLESAGLNPSFLIGGVANNFSFSARYVKDSDYFVIEADEYDTSFFDKRAKFIHYRPELAVINNIEFDHADIYQDLEAIVNQFHQMVRTMPSRGKLTIGETSPAVQLLLQKGVWCPVEKLDQVWTVKEENDQWLICNNEDQCSALPNTIVGEYNAKNALAAITVCQQAGVSFEQAIEALADFKGVKRRLELIYNQDNIMVYDDFAHHPTAIKAVLETLHQRKNNRLLAVVEFGSRTMQMGMHRSDLVDAFSCADHVYCQNSHNLKWSIEESFAAIQNKLTVADETAELVEDLKSDLKPGDCVVVLRNTHFDGLHEKLVSLLR